jgi:glycosyltransferase involved in cell wall biosynthesis
MDKTLNSGASPSQELRSRPQVLVFAFACDPYAGSEPGAGWGVVRTCAEVADLLVLVPPGDMRAIEKWQQNHNDERISFVEVPYPRFVETVGRQARPSNLSLFVCYLLWLRSAKKVARRLALEYTFDLCLHAAIGSYWLPSPVVQLHVPSVWGSVGGATTTPWRLWRFLGWRGLAGELVKWVSVRSAALLPPTRKTWKWATIRIAESDSTREAFPRALQADTRVINRAILQEVPAIQPPERKRYLLFPSALEPRKGPRLALLALAQTPPSVSIIFAADGHERRMLERMAKRLGIEDRTEFRGRIPRIEMFHMMAEAAAAVFTGLREEGGCALSEAMQLGTPVIVLAHGGARLVAQANTDPNRVALIQPGPAKQTMKKFAAAMTRFSAHPLPVSDGYLDCQSTKKALQQALLDALVKPADSRTPAPESSLAPKPHPTPKSADCQPIRYPPASARTRNP